MKKKLIPLGVIAVLGGIAAGIHYEIPVVIALVLVFLAVFSAVCGIQMIVTRKADIPTSDSFDPTANTTPGSLHNSMDCCS